jgi:hypothetical protein
MRFIEPIPHPHLSIGLYAWNGKYIVKFEAFNLEQTYKVKEMDITGVDDVKAMLNPAFIEKVMLTFEQMHQQWQQELDKVV